MATKTVRPWNRLSHLALRSWPAVLIPGSFPKIILLLIVAVLPQFSDAQGLQTPSQWSDTCTAEELYKYRSELCPGVFFVSTIAFNPFYANALNSELTIVMMPAQTVYASAQDRVKIYIKLPTFEPVGTVSPINQYHLDLTLTGHNEPVIGQNAGMGYNTLENPAFDNPAKFDIRTKQYILSMRSGMALKAGVDTEIRLCCLKLPPWSIKDDTNHTIAMTTDSETLIAEEPILESPYLDFGLQWKNIRMEFDPPITRSMVAVNLIATPASNLGNGCRIILHLPGLLRNSGTLLFDTDGTTDWLLFMHHATWEQSENKLTFFMREDKVWPVHHTITLRTGEDFFMATTMEINWDQLLVEARSSDDIDQLIRKTPVSQSSRVPEGASFLNSSLSYGVNVPGAMTDITLRFRTNRPLFGGTVVYARLSGFQAQVTYVPLHGKHASNFMVDLLGPVAMFDLPANLLTLTVAAERTIYSNEEEGVVTFKGMILPDALYENDASLMLSTSDRGSLRQPIAQSPSIGGGIKTFRRSQVEFEPAVPKMASNITVTLLPTVVLYQGDRILLHLYDFHCQLSRLPLVGPGAVVFGGVGVWFESEMMLLLSIAKNEVVDNRVALSFTVPIGANMRLPSKVAKNDGQLSIESVGNIIIREPMKKSPKIGPTKQVDDSSLTLETVTSVTLLSLSIVRMVFEWRLNCDVIPNSTVYITLGGMVRELPSSPSDMRYLERQSGIIELWGKNAPMFSNIAHWDATKFLLTLQVIPDAQIFAGDITRFYIEVNQYFRAPYAMYSRDPSFFIHIPGAGIPPTIFNRSTRVSLVRKAFTYTKLCYDSCYSTVSFPQTVVDFVFKFTVNVDLPEGSIIRIRLPGFNCPLSVIPLTPIEIPLASETDLSSAMKEVLWDQRNYLLDVEVPPGIGIFRNVVHTLRIQANGGDGLMLPSFQVEENDERLTVQVVQTQIIYEEPIKESPPVSARTFKVSRLTYLPAVAESIVTFDMELQPAVPITAQQDIVMFLPGFVNALGKENVHVDGRDRGYILQSMARWNTTRAELTLKVATDTVIRAFTTIRLRIWESQGFILPASLKANDTRLGISSKNNINLEPIKHSPIVGDGPLRGHRVCMYQFEKGVRTTQTWCPAAVSCDPPLTDPCSDAELTRCGCELKKKETVQLTLQGFQLLPTDTIYFNRYSELCGMESDGSRALNEFAPPSSINVSAEQDMISFQNLSSIGTGKFRMCVVHAQEVFDAGIILVRPSCRDALVFNGGACVHNCPRAKIPIAGNCEFDPVAKEESWQKQTLMLPVMMRGGLADLNLAHAHPSDSRRIYFIYVFRYDLAKLLDTDPERIKVVTLSAFNGSLIINTVLDAVMDVEGYSSTERSPMALVSLFRALLDDGGSQLYASSFFNYVVRDWSREAEPLKVMNCPKEPPDTFSPFCPYREEGMSDRHAIGWFFGGLLIVAILGVVLCVALWHIDYDARPPFDEDTFERAYTNPQAIMPELRLEFANSWLQGRYPGEMWQRDRHMSLLPSFDGVVKV